MPRGPDGMSEVSKPSSSAGRLSRNRGIINGRVRLHCAARFKQTLIDCPQTLVAPLAAITMAGLLFVYARTSIRAAKLNAQKHREADGGQISWHKESLRRHGQLEKVDNDRSTIKEAFMADVSRKKQGGSSVSTGEVKARAERSADEEQLRKMMGKDN